MNDQYPTRPYPYRIIPEEWGKGGEGGKTEIQDQQQLTNIDMTPELQYKHRSRFLAHFTGMNTFQTFSDKKDKKPNLAHVFHGNTHKLDDLNEKGAGIFLTINETDGKGRRRENITRIRAVFVDLDGADVNPVLEQMPNLVVESSPGKYHGYWFVKDFPVDGFSAVQKRIAEIFNGDPVVHDTSRVMRVPGYWHQKGDPFCSRIVFENHTEPLTYAEVVAKFPPKPTKQWSAPKYNEQQNTNNDYTGPYGTGKGSRNHGLARFVGGMVKRKFDMSHIENEAMKWGQSCSPPMKKHEILSVVRSISRYN